MSGFIRGEACIQATLLPELIDAYITEENPFPVPAASAAPTSLLTPA